MTALAFLLREIGTDANRAEVKINERVSVFIRREGPHAYFASMRTRGKFLWFTDDRWQALGVDDIGFVFHPDLCHVTFNHIDLVKRAVAEALEREFIGSWAGA